MKSLATANIIVMNIHISAIINSGTASNIEMIVMRRV
jgi:hypothetical protein